MNNVSRQHEIEKDFIGLILQNPDKLPDCMEILQPVDITSTINRDIYEAAIKLYNQSGAVDIVQIKNLSGADVIYVSQLLDTLPGNVVKLAQQLKERSVNRWAESYVKSSLGRVPLSHIADTLSNYSATEALNSSHKNPDIRSIIARLETLMEKNAEQGSVGIPTGFDFLEKRQIQYILGELWSIGGWTSVGKSYLMVEMICRLLKSGNYKIQVFSTEMTEQRIVARILANITGFNANTILSGMLHANLHDRLAEAINLLKTKHLTIYDNIFSLPEITARITKDSRQKKLDIVFVDYLQNCTVPGAKDIYTEMSRLIKSLQHQAKLSDCCIIVLSQLSNAAAKEENGLLAFKGAGEIVATSDVSLKLNRLKNEQYLNVDIAKSRNWEKGCQVLQFQKNWTSLAEVEHEFNR